MTRPDQDLRFSLALTDQNSVKRNWNSNFNGTQVDKWTNIIISQQKVQKDEEDCEKYVQTITIDGNQVFKRRNTAAREFAPVNVFASSHNFPVQPGVIRNFVIQDGNTGPGPDTSLKVCPLNPATTKTSTLETTGGSTMNTNTTSASYY